MMKENPSVHEVELLIGIYSSGHKKGLMCYGKILKSQNVNDDYFYQFFTKFFD